MSDIAVFRSHDGVSYDFAYILTTPVTTASTARGPAGPDHPGFPRCHVVMTYTNLPSDPDEPWRVAPTC